MMNLNNLVRSSILAASGVLVAFPTAAAQDLKLRLPIARPIGTATSSTLDLALPTPAPNPLLVGSASLGFNPEEDPIVQSLSVSIEEGADFGTFTYDLFIADGNGTLTNIGPLEGSEESGEFLVDESDPVALEAVLIALGVGDLGQTQGRLLEIRRNGSTTVLIGAVPLLGSSSLCTLVDRSQPQVRGRLSVRRQGSFSSLEIFVNDLDLVNSAYGLWFETSAGSGLFDFASSVQPARPHRISPLPGPIRYRVDTAQGESLPLGVTSLDDLVGRRYLVVDDIQNVVVEGEFPSLAPAALVKGNSKVSWPFVHPETFVPDAEARGNLTLTSQGSSGRQQLEIQLRLRPTTNFLAGTGRLFVEVAPGSSVFNEVGCLLDVRPGNRSVQLRLRTSTDTGEPLPLGAPSFAGLAGRRIQVQDPGGLVYLEGYFPNLPVPGTRPRVLEASEALSNLDPTTYPGAEAVVRLVHDERTGLTELRLDTLGLSGGPIFEVFAFDPRFGVLRRITNIAVPGATSYTVQTKLGQPLPLGVQNPRDLAGVAIEIREQSGSGLVFAGVFPTLP